MSTIPCYFCKYGRKKYQRLLIVAFSVSNQLKPSSRPQTIHLQPSTTIHPITQQITQKPTKLLGALVPHVFFLFGCSKKSSLKKSISTSRKLSGIPEDITYRLKEASEMLTTIIETQPKDSSASVPRVLDLGR